MSSGQELLASKITHDDITQANSNSPSSEKNSVCCLGGDVVRGRFKPNFISINSNVVVL